MLDARRFLVHHRPMNARSPSKASRHLTRPQYPQAGITRPAAGLNRLDLWLEEGALPVEVLVAKVIQHLIQVLLLVQVQAGRGGGRGGKRQGSVDELLGKRGQLLRGGFAAANSEQNKR